MIKIKHRNNFMKMVGFLLIIAITVLAGVSVFTIKTGASGEENSISMLYIFSFPEPSIEIINGTANYSVTMGDLPVYGDAGVPLLPVKPVRVLLPQKSNLSSIDVVFYGNVSMGYGYNVSLGAKLVSFDEQNTSNESINYNTSKPYPGELFSYTGMEYLRGYTILTMILYPVHYVNNTGEIYYYEDMSVNITVVTNGSVDPFFRKTPEDMQMIQSDEEILDDYNMISTYTEVINYSHVSCGPFDSDDEYKYVIITNEDLKSEFQELVDYKISRGISATVVTVEDIEDCEDFRWNDPEYGDGDPFFDDKACHIRNFIKFAYQQDNWNTDYILLGGDVDVIPIRRICTGVADIDGFREDDVPSDLYFACIHGTYNHNFATEEDEHWGEDHDGDDGGEVDLLPEVYIGRACVSTGEEVSNFVYKTKTYMGYTDNNYLKQVTMAARGGFGEVLDTLIGFKIYYNTWGFPGFLYDFTTFYGNEWTNDEFKSHINEDDVHIINYYEHGHFYECMGMNIKDVDGLTNDKYFFIYSLSCIEGGFDLDNLPDLVVVNNSGDNVHVLLGDYTYFWIKSGGWEYDVGDSPYDVVAGDFDKDGYLDVAVTNNGDDSNPGSVSVLYGDGSGVFDDRKDFYFSEGDRPYGIVAGDFHEDGNEDLDLAVTLNGADKIGVLYYKGSRDFENLQKFDVLDSPYNITAGDFDKDWYLDLAVTNYGEDTVSILFGDVGGVFVNRKDVSVGDGPSSIVAGDFDLDEDLDLAFTLSGEDKIGVLYNKGDGDFEIPETFDVEKDSPYGVVAGDFNKDGYLDLAVANYGADYVSVFNNDQLGGFEDPYHILVKDVFQPKPFDIVADDFDLDEDIDLVVTLPGDNKICTLINDEGVFNNNNIKYTSICHPTFGIVTGIFAYNVAERLMVKNKDYGAFAGILNTREGVTEGDGINYPSSLFCRYFWNAIHNPKKGIRKLGPANQDSKEMSKIYTKKSIGLLNSEDTNSIYLRHLLFTITLFGDPQLEIKIPSLFNKPVSKPTQPDGLTNGLSNTKYTFSTSAEDQDGDQVFYKWNWGDGTHTCWLGPYDANETVNSSHKWLSSSPQKCYVTVKARDTINGSESEWSLTKKVVIILGSEFNVCPSIYSIPSQTVYFNDTSSGYYQIVNWTWNYGDGNISYEQNTSHNYLSEGVYNVTLTVTDNQSNEVTSYQLVYIDTIPPEINEVSNNPETVGYGYNITITAELIDNISGIDSATVNITYPNSTTGNYTMNNIGNDTYQYVFSDTWLVGQYNYTIWTVDHKGNSNSSTGHSFNVSAQATISVCTIKDDYGNNETINLTDPPGDPSLIGYELLDDGEVLHIWNNYDSYYFNTTSGIQLTNHYNEYWSHNVLMLGYYNNNQWNLIYRTDELSGFNKNISSDNETFVNATLWKDLTYQGYDFRLALRYHLGVDDKELTVIPYIKNLGQAIPYNLGFAWELKDIQVDMTPSGDYIEINGTTYYLNQSLDETYKNMDQSCIYIREDISSDRSESLYLCWNDSLDYLVKVKSRDGQYNAPVTLGIKIGTLGVGQEKYTSLLWHDASEITYYFNSYNTGEAWATNPSYMVDESPSTCASTTINGDVELCNGNNCLGNNLGTISKVELRVSGYYAGSQRDTILRPVFGGTTDGIDYHYQTTPGTGPAWSPWFDITNDPFFTPPWSWTKVDNLDCDVESESSVGLFTLYCSKVEIRVTYIPNSNPVISNPYPADGSTGISIAPVLNITVSDPDGNNMNITWLSNSSGSWVAFGYNNSVSNGIYHKTMSNASTNGKWWYWKVNVTDGINYTESSVYKFYTGYQSKINNTGSYHFKGYLLIQIQYYNVTSQSWIVADDTINESSPRTILWADPGGTPGQNILALDTIFNGLVSTSDLSWYGNGTYRVYACFRDPDGNVLVCDDDSLMEATYEFTINL